ncbi:hypothetical protein M3G03_01395 [Aestuariimicrobium sp. p3-SID1156]|uniref:hypothetical protein n=1 Tax=Aestuariimicrobium sp. p3-SID1156 TaxID=2916038 RepID=UPI00223C3A6F|nr:hypothetical protein [Aestuariimicrobium sp. p3-SID1156]MCT1458209.1 hypothetical protein [Aestuariimicrobium sp. p3-SID1156]
MDTDDLRAMLQEEGLPEGLDGEKVLAFAHRARTRRRVVAAGTGAAAVITAVAVAFGVNSLRSDEPQWAQAPSPTTSPTSTSDSPSPVSTRTVSTRTVSTPTVSTPTVSTRTPSTPTPASSAPGSGSSAGSTGRGAGSVTSLCTPDLSLQFRNSPNLLTMGPGGTMGVDLREDGWVEINGRSVLDLGEGDVVNAQTDGRYVALLATPGQNAGEASSVLYRWDAQTGGNAVQVQVGEQVFFNGDLQVRDGWALLTSGGEMDTQRIHLVNLDTGASKVVHVGEYGTAELLPQGAYAVYVPGSSGMVDSGDGPARPTSADGSTVAMYSPIKTNGTTWVFANSNPGEGGAKTMVWSPAMPKPLELHADGSDISLGSVGTNYALSRQGRDGDFHLVDLRTGAHVVLPSGPQGPYYRLTPQDVLLRNPGTTHNATGTKGWSDLSTTTLRC